MLSGVGAVWFHDPLREGLSKHFQGVQEIKIFFIIILKPYLPFKNFILS